MATVDVDTIAVYVDGPAAQADLALSKVRWPPGVALHSYMNRVTLAMALT